MFGLFASHIGFHCTVCGRQGEPASATTHEGAVFSSGNATTFWTNFIPKTILLRRRAGCVAAIITQADLSLLFYPADFNMLSMKLFARVAHAAKRGARWITQLAKSAFKRRPPPTYIVPHDVVLQIAGVLKARHQYKSLAQLRSTSKDMYSLISPVLLNDVADARSAERIFMMIDLVTGSGSGKGGRAKTSRPSGKIPFNMAAVHTFMTVCSLIHRLTLDLPAFETLCRVLVSDRQLLIRFVDHRLSLMPALKYLTIRFNELDPGRLEDWYPVMEGRGRAGHWNVQAMGYDSFRDDESYVANKYQRWVASFFKPERLCVIPQPDLYGDRLGHPHTGFMASQWRRRHAEEHLTFCSFPAKFATIHNVHRYPCTLPDAKVVRIVFLHDVDPFPLLESMPDYMAVPAGRGVQLKRYDERLETVRVMLHRLGPDVRKVVFVGLERAVDPAIQGDITKKQFYSKLRKAVRKARTHCRMDPGGTLGPRGGKLKYVILDGERKGKEVKTCSDCGSGCLSLSHLFERPNADGSARL